MLTSFAVGNVSATLVRLDHFHWIAGDNTPGRNMMAAHKAAPRTRTGIGALE